jgi:putative protease
MSIELLAPAGSPEALDAAVGEGADAVYLGLKNFNARMRSANFTYAQFEAALRSLRRMGKKLYVTVNTVFEQREADRMYQLLKYLAAVGPDALIVQDFGVLAMLRSEFPQLKIHASTQMNIASGKGCNALSRQGVSRVVLARELSLEELRSIRSETNVELEIFVHGALCVSASGLCLFSSYLGGKSANRGMCTQACRRLYHHGDIDSGYYFSPADLQLLEHVPDIAAAGINALKIEGRMKSADYVGAVVSAYRLVLDAIIGGNEENIQHGIAEARKILQGDFARDKTAFLFNEGNSVNWLNPSQDGGTGISLGMIKKAQGKAGERRALLSEGTGMLPAEGDSIRLHRRDDSERVSHKVQFVAPSQ